MGIDTSKSNYTTSFNPSHQAEIHHQLSVLPHETGPQGREHVDLF